MKSARNSDASAAISRSAPASRACTPASANTAAGPTQTTSCRAHCSRRSGAARRVRTSGTRASASPSATASGTTHAGSANSSGTNASWVSTVKPNGVSNEPGRQHEHEKAEGGRREVERTGWLDRPQRGDRANEASRQRTSARRSRGVMWELAEGKCPRGAPAPPGPAGTTFSFYCSCGRGPSNIRPGIPSSRAYSPLLTDQSPRTVKSER